MSSLRFVLDGTAIDEDAEPLEPLRPILERRLGSGTVPGPCEVGACGACTVLLDDRPVLACLQPAGLVAGRRVTTAAALPANDPVVRAFAEHRAFQCGSCTPGFVLAVRAAIAGAAPPLDRGAWVERLAGNLCRCGSYRAILDAAEAAAAAAAKARPTGGPDGHRGDVRLLGEDDDA